MKGIGYWKEENGIGLSRLQSVMHFFGLPVTIKSEFLHEYADPQKLVGSGLSPDDKIRLVDYLRSGKVYAKWLGFSHCRFHCGVLDSAIGASDLSDGTWVWPEGLAHYVEQHDIRLPKEFIIHVKNSDFKINDSIRLSNDARIDMEFWDNWCKNTAVRRVKLNT